MYPLSNNANHLRARRKVILLHKWLIAPSLRWVSKQETTLPVSRKKPFTARFELGITLVSCIQVQFFFDWAILLACKCWQLRLLISKLVLSADKSFKIDPDESESYLRTKHLQPWQLMQEKFSGNYRNSQRMFWWIEYGTENCVNLEKRIPFSNAAINLVLPH